MNSNFMRLPNSTAWPFLHDQIVPQNKSWVYMIVQQQVFWKYWKIEKNLSNLLKFTKGINILDWFHHVFYLGSCNFIKQQGLKKRHHYHAFIPLNFFQKLSNHIKHRERASIKIEISSQDKDKNINKKIWNYNDLQ